jgi:hypothetical protein
MMEGWTWEDTPQAWRIRANPLASQPPGKNHAWSIGVGSIRFDRDKMIPFVKYFS